MKCIALLHNILIDFEGLRDFSSNDCGSLDANGGTQFKKCRMHNCVTASARGQGESAGPYRGHRVTERGRWWPEEGSSYSPGAVDADYNLSLPNTVCAWRRAIPYER